MVALHLSLRRLCLLCELAVLEEQSRAPFFDDYLRDIKPEDSLLDAPQKPLEVSGLEMRPAQNAGVDDDVEDVHGLSCAVGCPRR